MDKPMEFRKKVNDKTPKSQDNAKPDKIKPQRHKVLKE
jgi:hypothetical protein